MAIIIVFALGFIFGRLAQARKYNMALPGPARVVELPEPEKIVTTTNVIVETPAETVQEPQEAPITNVEPMTDKEKARRRREAEKAAIAEQKREQAQIDLDHYTMQRERLMELADVVEHELTTTITDKRRAALMRQRITLEERLYQTEKKMNRAYFIINSFQEVNHDI